MSPSTSTARFLSHFSHTLLLVVFLVGLAHSEPAAYDVIIVGGTVIDGSGNPGYRANVGIRGDRIARVGQLKRVLARRQIIADGLVVSPGFIDPHSHARGNLFEIPTAKPFLLQGITTVIDGNDGSSPLQIGEFLRRVAEHGVSPNLGLYIGHGTVRREVMGMAAREPSWDELEEMKRLVAVGMVEGALGLSTGLAYAPGNFANTEEVIELARVAGALGGIYMSHMRDEGTHVLDSVRETIRIGTEARVPVQITHHKIGGHRVYGQSIDSIRMMREAREGGVDITFDQYPYTASSTGLGFIIPRWASADDGLRERLSDAEQRRRIVAGMLQFLNERFDDDPHRIQLVGCGPDAAHAGRTLADLLEAENRALSPAETVDKIIELQLSGGCGAIFHSFAEEDVERLLQSEYGMIGSDGGLSHYGQGKPHPRGYGAYPRVLGRYVRERGSISLPQAIRKMTSFPAQRLGLQEQGLVREGMMADIVVFDPMEIVDRATFTEPHQYSEGVEYVLVAGTLVIDSGEHTGARPGRVLLGPAAR